ncbi:MAG: cation transporter [Marinobacter sp.]|uniref:cation transporter n=1 Tax=Marinobacter sp. TaxID=50741 RepID=UPI003F98B1B7
MITLVCALSLVSAIVALLKGGRAVSADRALIFAAVSVLGCVAVWLYLKWAGRAGFSGLVIAEQQQWFMDAVLSAAVLVGFGFAWWLEQSARYAWAVYADPVKMTKVGPNLLMEISLPANWPGRVERLKWALLRHLAGLPVRPAIFMRSLVS